MSGVFSAIVQCSIWRIFWDLQTKYKEVIQRKVLCNTAGYFYESVFIFFEPLEKINIDS